MNGGDCFLFIYFGFLMFNLGNVVYFNFGVIFLLFNDLDLEIIGVGIWIFLGGGIGYIIWEGI